MKKLADKILGLLGIYFETIPDPKIKEQWISTDKDPLNRETVLILGITKGLVSYTKVYLDKDGEESFNPSNRKSSTIPFFISHYKRNRWRLQEMIKTLNKSKLFPDGFASYRNEPCYRFECGDYLKAAYYLCDKKLYFSFNDKANRIMFLRNIKYDKLSKILACVILEEDQVIQLMNDLNYTIDTPKIVMVKNHERN